MRGSREEAQGKKALPWAPRGTALAEQSLARCPNCIMDSRSSDEALPRLRWNLPLFFLQASMGNNYTTLSTQDPNDMLAGRDRSRRVDEGRGGCRVHGSTSLSSGLDKAPSRKTPVHSDAIGALAAVRPGMVISGGRDKVSFFVFPSASQQIALTNIDTHECVLRWSGHEKEVTKVSFLLLPQCSWCIATLEGSISFSRDPGTRHSSCGSSIRRPHSEPSEDTA